ncbi:alpha/beta fold hydrolase [Streptomyces sp. B1866]|uniref:lipase family alpha/beta hydrolase n=1 Tax=Streptomyces sp. B1866 TaxID=3075431 RepID=UPI0028903472|nr:alpha/beta fold hydrolase [Streptomyces sp. B1866]MDT3398978.1 alpha/beta fold hydrolase [Streptomyces sp. B1866]
MTKARRTDHRSPARTVRRWLAAAGAAFSLAAVAATASSPASAATGHPVGDLGTAVQNFFTSPDKVAGANDWDCEPSAEHPDPVVLVHATGVNLGANWVRLSPELANAGYCVFAFNYGMQPLSLGRVGGLDDVVKGAKTMSTFVDKVLAKTGAEKVDVVGHSQGGMMPNYYIKRLGGAQKVDTFVGMAPSNHGTTLSGLTELGKQLHLLGFVNGFFDLTGLQALHQQEVGSQFQKDLFEDGDTVPGPRYVVIATKHDQVVTPYTNAFLKGDNVTNILLQDQCPNSDADHVGLFLDGPTMQNVLNVLGPNDPGFKPDCAA